MKRHLLMWLLCFTALELFAQLKVSELTVENLVDPILIDNVNPRFSWKLINPAKNTLQTAYQLQITDGRKVLWNSGKQVSDQSVQVPYAGASLAPNSYYRWTVKVWDNHGKSTQSSSSSFRTGLMNPANWKAKWIEGNLAEDSVNRPAHLFRKEFNLSKKIKSATAYITAHGMYEAVINGKRVGDDYLTPGWTSYNKRLQYMAYDVTKQLVAGKNAVGAVLASGWYRTSLLWDPLKNVYGSKLGLLFQLHVTYADGSQEIIISDDSWKSFDKGPIISSELYEGEVFDANLDDSAWAKPGYDDSKWSTVSIKDHPVNNIVATYNEGVKKHESLDVIKVITTPKGEKVIDFGQNLVGWVELTTAGDKGDSIKIFHAEVLDKDGNFYTTNLRGAKQRNIYILNGKRRMYEPHFTFQGFRYIKVEGYNGELQPGDFKAVVLYSGMRSNGTFTCSNALINQLQKNIVWGQKGNFVDIPTDCPQRDERLGWTGDAQVFARTAAFNMNVRNFFSKWLKDLAADQLKDGKVPAVIPTPFQGFIGGSAGWGDAATIIPWEMYQVYGDKQFLTDQYESMKEWIRFMQENSANDLWNKGHHFGDWLFYRPNDDVDGKSAITDKFLIAQCFWAHSTQLVINTAKLLGKNEDVTKYSAMLQRIKDAFIKEYVTATGRIVSSTQTAYVLALNFDMLPEALRKQAADRLVENIKAYDYHLTTGFLGTPYLCHVLSRFGHNAIAYKLLMQETYPSWLYPVKMGATTIWERWDGQKTDGTFQNPDMNSFNHYAYGAVGDWMYRTVAGIDLIEPGYKKIRIHPQPDSSLNSASAIYESVYGTIASGWERRNGRVTVKVSIPCNTTAEVILPGRKQTIGSGNYEFSYLVE